MILEEETHRLLGPRFEGDKEKDCGLIEPVYQECLGLELARQGIEFLAQEEISLTTEPEPGRLLLFRVFRVFRGCGCL